MSNACAEFFAKKNKKKRSFKPFNANLIDHSEVTSSVHVDAPAVSNESEVPVASAIATSNNDTGDWDENALASRVAKAAVASTVGTGAAEIMEMKGMKRNEQEDIAEKLRVEETKKQLEAARIGMEKEAQRLKEEQAAAEAKKKEREANRFGVAAANVGGGIGGASKWVPSRMRNTMPAPSVGSRFGAAATATGFQKKVDTKDEELFPDLATADKLIQQEEAQKAEKAAAASAANKARAIASKPRWGMKADKEKEEEKKPEEVKEVPAPAPVSAPVAAPAPTAVKKKKKKKKDLSTFKSS